VVGAIVGYGLLKFKYEAHADSYDLATMDQMESATSVYDRNGVLLGKFFIQNRNPIPWEKIPPLMVQAVVAAEDNRFYEHNGVDYMGVFRAALKNYRSGRIKQGASTVTQQLARNSFELRERTYERKIVEMLLASRIEKSFSKEKIMELYLNRVYFGSGLYGIEAAARGYFGVAPLDLSAGQCAMLAGLLRSPNGLSPWNSLDGARNARNFVLGRMKDEGFLTSEQMRQEQDSVLITRRRTNPHKTGYAVDFVRQQIIAALGFEKAMQGGYRVTTTLDARMQRTAEIALRNRLNAVEQVSGYRHQTYAQFEKIFEPFDETLRKGGFPSAPPRPEYLQGAAIAIDTTTGAILTLVGGREFKHSEYNRATQARRPIGTAITPFVFAAAYENGVFPGQIVQDAALDNRYVNIGGTTGILGEWGVERVENSYQGGIPARDALSQSKNSATVRVGWMAGLDAFKSVIAKAGIRSPVRNFSNAFLGTSEMTLDELTLAYTIFPGQGWRPERTYIIQHIEDQSGAPIYSAASKKLPVIEDSTAYQVHAGLVDAIRSGTGAAAFTTYGLADIPAAGKTGTAYNFTDTYFFGYTNRVTCGVWIGFDKPTTIFRGAFGNTLALPVWTDVMNNSLDSFKPSELERPASLTPVSVCRSSGLLETPRCEHEVIDPNTGAVTMQKTSYIEYATEAQRPRIPCDVHGPGMRLYEQFAEEDSEWPRAAPAVDLASIRPVAVEVGALAGFTDVYGSVRPAALRLRQEDIPVARAVAINENGDDIPEGEVPLASAVPVAEPENTGEVRRAEMVRPLDSPLSSDIITIAPPEPIQF
jgi:penicillin-binding protein 1A